VLKKSRSTGKLRSKGWQQVEFDIAYNVHCSIRLQSGRKITLDRLTQSLAYASLLEGTPNKKSNDHSIRGALDRARRAHGALGEPYLIEPERRDYFREKGDMQCVLERQRDRPAELKHIPEWLPPVECIGVCHSTTPARDRTKDASSLTVVWYQDDFGIDDRAIELVRLVDWDRHATDWDY